MENVRVLLSNDCDIIGGLYCNHWWKYSYILGPFKTGDILSIVQVKFKDNTNKNLLSFDKASSEVYYELLYDQTYGLI